MGHETHSKDNSTSTSFNSSFWFVLILAGLFIAAVNFVNVMSSDEEHGGEGHEAIENVHHTEGETQEVKEVQHKEAEQTEETTHGKGH